MGHADLVTHRSELPQGIGILPQLLSRFIADRVDNEVGMGVGSITMSGHQYLITGPRLFRKLQSNLVGLLVCEVFFRGKGLDILVEMDAVQFVICPLGCHKFRGSVQPVAVDSADKPLPCYWVNSLILPLAVGDHGTHSAHTLAVFFDISYRRHGFPPMRTMAS